MKRFIIVLLLTMATILPQTAQARAWGMDNCHESPEINALYYYMRCFDDNGFAIVTPSSATMEPMGMIDKTGKEILPLKYQFIVPVESATSAWNHPSGYIVKYQDKFSYINDKAKATNAIDYDELIDPYSQFDVLVAIKDNRAVLLNLKGEVISAPYDRLSVRNSTIIATQNRKHGYLNSNGQPITAIIYDDVGEFDEQGRALVELAGKQFYIDTQGNVLP